jgi:transposase
LARVKAQLGPEDFTLFRRLVDTWLAAIAIMDSSRTMLSRLRRLFGLSSTEKTSAVLRHANCEAAAASAQTDTPEAQAGQPPEDGSPGEFANSQPLPDEPPQQDLPKGHGRLPASAYRSATQVRVDHQSLKLGDPCPACPSGKLYELADRARYIRIIGQPVLQATCWNCQRLRCSGCGHVYTARPPPEGCGSKFDTTAVAMIALCRYSIGLPHHRLAKMQKHMGLPVPVSTQWDLMRDNAPAFEPVFAELERHAAQGTLLHNDDTYARVLEFMGKRRVELLRSGELPAPDRVGLFTTGIVSFTNEQPIVLFYTGRKYAGENLAELLKARAVDLEPPTLMSDGLESRNLPTGHAVKEVNCLAHARRGVVDQVANFPDECRHIIEQLREVYRVEALCKRDGLSAVERLARHQESSAPVMAALEKWLETQLAEKRVEPNSDLGKAYNYMLKRWQKLTGFLREPGVPIDNNTCERALKMAIRHRRNSMFYRSDRGAEIGDMFMSLIYTTELRGENPFDYLDAVLRNDKAAAQHPADWLPWTYRETLARLGQL